jgi:hypothetical protein
VPTPYQSRKTLFLIPSFRLSLSSASSPLKLNFSLVLIFITAAAADGRRDDDSIAAYHKVKKERRKKEKNGGTQILKWMGAVLPGTQMAV